MVGMEDIMELKPLPAVYIYVINYEEFGNMKSSAGQVTLLR